MESCAKQDACFKYIFQVRPLTWSTIVDAVNLIFASDSVEWYEPLMIICCFNYHRE